MIGLLCAVLLSQSEIRVIPGEDIEAALRVARESGLRKVVLAPGVHRLRQPVRLTVADNGLTLEGAGAVLSGGEVIDGWTVDERGWWTAAAAGNFTQLWVDGQRRYRPRFPREGFLKIGPRAVQPPETASRGFDRMRYFTGDVNAAWKNRDDIETVTFHNWTISRMRIKSVEETQRFLVFTGLTRCASDWCSFVPGNRYFFDNVADQLGAPGEWYHDRAAARLTYIPREGEEPREIIVPRLEQLLVIDGAVDVTVRGLSFEHTNYVWPQAGYSSFQSEVNLDGAIVLRNAQRVMLDGARVAHTGRHGIVLNGSSRENTIQNSTLFDLGAGGIRVGESARSNPTPDGNVIRNNIIVSGGRHHPAGCGILITHSGRNTVENNTIRDFYYTGISVGWSWGYNASAAAGNLIRANRIGQLGQGVLSDMGGIYTLGVSPGTQVTRNLIYDVDAFDYGGWGIYPDEGSTGILIKDNIVYRTKTGGFHQHYGRDNHVVNNLFLEAHVQQLQKTRIEPHNQFLFEKNVVAGSEGLLLGGGGVAGADMQFRNNLYWLGGAPLKFGGQTWEQWRARGTDEGSVVADPKLNGIDLAPDSPAFALGFEAIDLAASGSSLSEPLDPPVPPAFPYSQKETSLTIRESLDDLEPGDLPLHLQPRPSNPAIPESPSGLGVSAEQAASGRHSLKFTDAEGRTDSYPHAFYNPAWKQGRLRGAFSLWLEPGMTFWHEWRDGSSPYFIGPTLRVLETGALSVPGQANAMAIPGRRWVRFEIVTTLGSGAWDLTVTVPGSEPRVFRGLAANRAMESLAWWGFVSSAARASAFYLDDVELRPEP